MRLRSILVSCAFLLAGACAAVEEITAPEPLQPGAVSPAQALIAGPPRVGLLLPLSGSAAQIGADMQDAAQLALFDTEASDLELLPRDTGDSPSLAAAAATGLIDAGAQLIIGPLFSSATAAVAPITTIRSVPVISFSNDASVARPGVYVLGFRPEEQVERVVDYAARQGLGRIAALGPDDTYGSRTIAAWRAAVARNSGLTAVAAETYPAGTPDPSAAVQRLAAAAGQVPSTETSGGPAPPRTRSDIDALLIADGGPRLRSIAALLSFYELDIVGTRLLGTMRWQDEPGLLAEPALRGAWFASWQPDTVEAFVARFQEVYGRRPAPLAVLAYDATALAALLARAPARFAPELLTDPQGFVGRAGIFRLRPDGLAQHGLAVLEAADGDARVIDSAPPSFVAGFATR